MLFREGTESRRGCDGVMVWVTSCEGCKDGYLSEFDA